MLYPCPVCGQLGAEVWQIPDWRNGEAEPLAVVHTDCMCVLTQAQEDAVIAEWEHDVAERAEAIVNP